MTKNQDFTVKKERLITIDIPFPFILKILGYIFISIGIWYIFIYKKYIYIYLTHYHSRNESLFFTILVSLTLMLFITACGIKICFSKKIVILTLIIILLLLISGYFEIGFGIEFRKHFGLLRYKFYESDSGRGIKFFVLNFLNFWIFVYLLSVALTGDDS